MSGTSEVILGSVLCLLVSHNSEPPPIRSLRNPRLTSLFSIAKDTSRIWTQLDLRYIDTHFPLDCFDDELAMDELAIRASVRARVNSETFEETPMTLNLVSSPTRSSVSARMER
jgi:hypothetical protein